MAKGDLYAWSRIKYAAVSKNGIIIEEKFVDPGEKVTAKQLFPDATPEQAQVEFDALCLSGAVRSVPYPKDLPLDALVSPRDHLMKQAMQAEEWAGLPSEIDFSAVDAEGAAAREGSEVMTSTPTAAPVPQIEGVT
jgi:hypothetical protein